VRLGNDVFYWQHKSDGRYNDQLLQKLDWSLLYSRKLPSLRPALDLAQSELKEALKMQLLEVL
jgi:hypothetical protein